MLQHLFVYGTLAPGRENHHVLANISGKWESATLKGFLLDAGWGAAIGYPGIIPSDQGNEVNGWVLTSVELARYLAEIDAFEGGEYKRISAQVNVKGGNDVEAYVYSICR